MTSPLRLNLDTAPFDKLVADARALIPQLAPTWTDHNLHDPGIMLLELDAWIADQQIYALSRDRRDERTAFAAAMGLSAGGAEPARGLLWPSADSAQPTWPNGTLAPKGRGVAPEAREGPGFVLDADVTLTTARIAGLAVEPPGGPVQAFPPAPPPDGLAPFGSEEARGARFHVRLDGPLSPANATGQAILALGVQTDGPAIAENRARLAASVRLGGAEVAVRIVADGTQALAQTGLLLLDLTSLIGRPALSDATLILSLERPLRPLPARITRIALNVLPIRQETVTTLDAKGTGLPDQEVRLPEDVRLDEGFEPVVVRLTGGAADELWEARDDLAAAGPAERVFHLDAAARLVRFGNDLNGKAPAVGDDLRVVCRRCAGAGGLVAAGTTWTVDHLPGRFWNPQPTEGGRDPRDLAQLRRESRARARDFRPLVTDADLRDAALAARDLRVRRAEVLAGYAPGDCPRLAQAARTLVALGADAGAEGSERPAWLHILRRRIRPRLTLGDRCRIIRPAYVRLRVRATVTPRSRVSPERLRAAVDDELAARLRLVPQREGDEVWRLGLDVQAQDLGGWLRRVDGVAAVRDVAVGEAGGPLGRAVRLPAHGLPVLVREAGDITVARAL